MSRQGRRCTSHEAGGGERNSWMRWVDSNLGGISLPGRIPYNTGRLYVRAVVPGGGGRGFKLLERGFVEVISV